MFKGRKAEGVLCFTYHYRIGPLISTPHNDIKMEKNRGDNRLGDAGKSKQKCDHSGKLGTLERNVRSYTVVLPKAVVVDV